MHATAAGLLLVTHAWVDRQMEAFYSHMLVLNFNGKLLKQLGGLYWQYDAQRVCSWWGVYTMQAWSLSLYGCKQKGETSTQRIAAQIHTRTTVSTSNLNLLNYLG